MEILITSIDKFKRKDREIIDVVSKGLNFSTNEVSSIVLPALDRHLGKLRPDLTVVIETEYVDCGYRDSYYSYYSTKLERYSRNCIRLSLFENTIASVDDVVLDADFAKKMQETYMGFIILRPLLYACVGRNVISPKAEINCKELAVCETAIKASCMGVKLNVCGFPHSSQDGEMMTCAETAIWAMMEYFGNKYSIYTPTLPSTISKMKESLSSERIFPSTGLTYKQISYILKQFGLGCVVYEHKNPRFKELFTCYVESGFPLAVCLFDKDETIGHAVVCVGRKNIPRDKIKEVPVIQASEDNGVQLRSWNTAINEFVFNDDNMPSYQIASFDEPVKHYEDDEWNNVKITHFIVPLYKKIYIDAETAIDISNNLLVEVIGDKFDNIVRTFLTSSRSYKDYIAKNEDFSQVEKQMLLTLDVAKFIWVTEYANMNSFCADKANGIILIDATGHIDTDDNSSIILYQKGTSAFVYNQRTKTHHEYENLMATKFNTFKTNLKNK